ncbi:MAG TPA: carnitine dehydratase [Chloroflexi bacterium]|nr:carnitine dehydratase [Chloroflexota bacterium]
MPLLLPLEGIRILDLTRVLAGPFCSWILGSLGAEVIKIERPGRGDQARDIGPFVAGESVYFMSINRAKRGITLDLKRGQEVLSRLISRSDVLLENFAPGVMERLGLSYGEVAAQNPRIVYASISGFGQTGPARDKRAYDQIIQSLSGVMAITGEPGHPPVRVGFSIGDLAAGLFCSTAVLAALRQRDVMGQGQRIDISMLDAVLALLENPVARYLATGESPGVLGSRHPTVTPNQAFRASDGWLVLAAGNDEQWVKFCHAIDRPDLAENPRYAKNAERTRLRDELEPILQASLLARTRAEWVERLEAAGVPTAPIHTIADAVNWDQTRARGMIREVQHPVAGSTRFVGLPIQASGMEELANSPAPTLGQDTGALLAELGFSEDEITSMRHDGVI